MTKLAARLALAFALVGLGASVAAAYVHYQLLQRSALHQLLRRQRDGELHAGLSEPLRHVARAFRSRSSAALWFVVRGAAVDRRHDRAAAGAREHPRLPVRAFDARARGGPLPAATRRSCILKAVLPDVPADRCRRHRDLHRLRRVHVGPDDRRCPAGITQDLRVLVGNPLAIAVTVLFVAGAASTLAFFPREGVGRCRDAPAPTATAGPAQRARAVHGDGARGSRSSSRATAPRC